MAARRAVPSGGFRRIAVLRLSSLGDVILTLPVVHALRAAFPGMKPSTSVSTLLPKTLSIF